MASIKRPIIARLPPKYIKYAKIPAAVNALNAVKNHPPITLSTPATRYTALSAPHARSAREVPIATINVTYVVDNGNLRPVAIEISTLATTRFTAARTISKAGASIAFVLVIKTGVKLLFILFLIGAGNILLTPVFAMITRRTRF